MLKARSALGACDCQLILVRRQAASGMQIGKAEDEPPPRFNVRYQGKPAFQTSTVRHRKGCDLAEEEKMSTRLPSTEFSGGLRQPHRVPGSMESNANPYC